MARMIPSVLSPEIKSNAEKRIFEWFRDDPNTEGWVVLHSLGIANHRTLLYGEIDFFVIAPKLGVFAIEVKGGRVKREDGQWHFTDKYGNVNYKKRGPFEQANEGIYSLFGAIKKKCGDKSPLNKILFGSGVMFPDITFEVEDIDGEQWQVFDHNDGKNVSAYIRRLSKYTREKWENKFNMSLPMDKLPDNKIVKEFANVLRSDFDKAVALSTQIEYAEEALVALTNEQMHCLDQIEDNFRCLIQGPAGTGKTLLAIEEVKRSVVNNEKVALFCYNSLLGGWLKSYFDNMPETLRPSYVGTFHSFMFSIVNKYETSVFPSDNMQTFFREEMPLMTLDALENEPIYFDKIIVDEAQDLLNTDYIDVFDIILKGGINRGRWSMFGDFSRQAIFEDNENVIEMLEEKTSFIKYKLKVNCRNTKPIGDEIKYVTGFESEEYLWTKADGPPVNYFIYRNEEEELVQLEEIIEKLLKGNIIPQQITILSSKKRKDSVASLVKKYAINDFIPFENSGITFSTIQAFKGLENSAIIITDVETYQHEKLMYVGLSRARCALIILETKSADTERKKMLMRYI